MDIKPDVDEQIAALENQIRVQESVLTKLKLRLEDLKKDKEALNE